MIELALIPFELSLDPSTSSDEFKDIHGNRFGTSVVNVVEGVSSTLNSPTDEVFDDDNDDKYLLPCQGYSREQWIGLNVIFLNDHGIPIADGVCRNTTAKDCVDANPLGDEDIEVCILKILHL